jgi:predicted SAM-dependent methyltransferase
MKLELGSGNRPTEGYLHQDIIQLDTKLDFCCEAWNICLDSESLSEVIAIAVMEHLKIEDFRRTLKHIYSLLKPEGVFYFDVPDIRVWSSYLFLVTNAPNIENTHLCPYSKTDIYKTVVGWNRWQGDEHKSLWIKEDVYYEVEKAGFKVSDGFEEIKKRVQRDRFNHPENAHIFIKAVK